MLDVYRSSFTGWTYDWKYPMLRFLSSTAVWITHDKCILNCCSSENSISRISYVFGDLLMRFYRRIVKVNAFMFTETEAMKLEDRVGLCYGSISLFSTVLHNVFLIYHIETFVSIYKIDKTSFWTGEMIFLIWNSLNDPLFGWLADSKQGATALPSDISYTAQSTNLSHELKTSTHIIVKRITVIRWCGPMMALSFATFWFDWNTPCVQFAICLCLYDTFLSLIDLQQSALLADLSITVQARANMTSYEAAFSAAGSISVFLSYQVWDRGNLIPFQTLCILLAVISAIGFYVMSTFLQSFISIPGHNTNYISNKDGVVPHNLSLKVYIRQLLAQKNFLRFTLINAIQVMSHQF